MIVVESMFPDEELSMSNPPIVTVNGVSIGDTFTFKGEHCTVVSINARRTGFNYSRQESGLTGFMHFWFYKTIPSQVSRNGRIVGIHRNQIKKEKLIRFIEGLY